jgi:hypothetical protein
MAGMHPAGKSWFPRKNSQHFHICQPQEKQLLLQDHHERKIKN